MPLDTNTNANAGEHFFRRLLRGILPMLVWLLHFAFCYGLAAAQCAPATLRPDGPDRTLLGSATVLALAACALLAWRARGLLRHPNDAGLLEWAAFVSAWLALIGVVWNAVPVLLVAGCA